MEQLTVKELLEECKEQIEKGNGDKLIAISGDSEGNYFHGLLYGFTEATDDYEDMINDSETDLSKIIILG